MRGVVIISVTEFELDDVVSVGSVNNKLKEFDQMFPLAIANGGTGATSRAQARKNLGIYRIENITTSGVDTVTLAKSINEYSYVRVYYKAWTDPYTTTVSTYFTHDVIGSTAMHALSISNIYTWNSVNYLICSNALARFSASGLTITLERNGGIVKNLNNGSVHVMPYTPPLGGEIDNKITISSVVGYK